MHIRVTQKYFFLSSFAFSLIHDEIEVRKTFSSKVKERICLIALLELSSTCSPDNALSVLARNDCLKENLQSEKCPTADSFKNKLRDSLLVP